MDSDYEFIKSAIFVLYLLFNNDRLDGATIVAFHEKYGYIWFQFRDSIRKELATILSPSITENIPSEDMLDFFDIIDQSFNAAMNP